MGYVVAVDAGTTGVRSTAVDESGRIIAFSYREFEQHFPRPGWVEHDADEIWTTTVTTMAELVGQLDGPIAAIGITNQRETIVAWSRTSGKPLHRAIVWQDRRTADYCASLEAEGHLPLVRARTGLVLDPYFSASKLRWLFDHGGVEANDDLAIGTIDSWLLWNLTGGAVHATEASNASRTLLFDIDELGWSDELCDLFGIPSNALPEVLPTVGRFGTTTDTCPLGAGLPISGMAGDQQSALFGQACFDAGDTKNTYGTGSFVLMNAGPRRPELVDGLLTSVGWTKPDGSVAYVLEGAIFVTGAAVQWLRDGLGIIESADQLEPLALQCEGTDGVFFVPALTGLGSPWWDPHARGTIVGLTRGSGRPQLARAALEAMVFQTRDVVDAMADASGTRPTVLRVDGGAAAMDTMLQLQADQLGVPVARPVNQQTTVMGAAFMAGLAEGVWASEEDVVAAWQLDKRFEPGEPDDAVYQRWSEAVQRSLGWDQPSS